MYWTSATPERNDNFAWMQHILASLDAGGRAAVVMLNTAGTSTDVRERAIRKVLAGPARRASGLAASGRRVGVNELRQL
ncbi:N-6 DNA methylase [Micromonospora sp. NPDC049799]|uniref:N-6 DNA methylase n=1 Tax=Micromonospora sp. NPDC049799 TaxID=3154741 RepID=UPI0033C3094B